MERYEKTYACGVRLYVPSPITYIYMRIFKLGLKPI